MVTRSKEERSMMVALFRASRRLFALAIGSAHVFERL
jgi:hypothetical protein